MLHKGATPTTTMVNQGKTNYEAYTQECPGYDLLYISSMDSKKEKTNTEEKLKEVREHSMTGLMKTFVDFLSPKKKTKQGSVQNQSRVSI